MTVTAPDDFGVLSAGGQEQIAYLEPILDINFEIVTRNATWGYASGQRRRVFTKDWRGVGFGTTSTTYIQVGEFLIKMSDLRSKLDMHFVRNNCDLKVDVYSADLATLYTSPENTAGTSAGVLSITSGIPAGLDGVVKVWAKVPTSGTARVVSLRAVERVLTSGELP